MQIEIDFDVWKALTQRRAVEAITYNDVLRDLLSLGPPAAAQVSGSAKSLLRKGGYVASGRYLPAGTELSARYKGAEYAAEVRDGAIFSIGGKKFKSLSAAARDVTGNNVNGLLFWKAKRPGDATWIAVAAIPKPVD